MAVKAGGLQSVLTFFTVFLNTILFQHFYIKKQLKRAVLVPAALTTTLSFLLHSYIGSPEPFFSALFVLVSALFFFSSLALISDATHNLSDVASLIISLIGMKLAQRAANLTFTYGYKKASIFEKSRLSNLPITRITS